MYLNLRSLRRGVGGFVVVTIALFDSLSGFTQSPQREQSFPTNNNPTIVILNAWAVTIDAWDKSEVSLKAEILGAAIKNDEVKVKADNGKVEITCQKSERKAFIRVSVPLKSVLEIKRGADKIQIKEPTNQIVISFVSKEVLQLSAPVSAALDLQDATSGSVRQMIGQGGNVVMSMGRSRTGVGPPFIKVTSPTAHVMATLGSNVPTSRRPATLAATTIARRNGLMSQALRSSFPQLIRRSTAAEQPVPVERAGKDPETLKLETHLVNLNVSATDRAGRAIPNLKKEDFSVYEDGVRQQISFFSPQQSPFNLVLLIDLSGSMREEIDLIRETAMHFLDVISSLDSVAVITFSTDVVVVSQLSKDRDDLRDSIDNMMPPTGGTAFYDALGYALVETLRKVKGQRNAIIAITDGEDNALLAKLSSAGTSISAGSFLTFEELLDGAKEADALIYPIHLDPAPPAPISPNIRTSPGLPQPRVQIRTNTEQQKLLASALTELATEHLHSLADASGGRFYHANRIDDLRGVFEEVAAELRTVYSMAYTPTNLDFDGRFRRIAVQVNRPDIAIRTRTGYYATSR